MMTTETIYPNPTVIRVIFQITFPHLFSIENKVGDLQDRIIEEFPESALLYRHQVIFVDTGSEGKIVEPPLDMEPKLDKIWQFQSPKKYKLNVLSSSLDISSEFHKTYNNPESPNRFRDIIEYVLNSFLEITKIPTINRIGLRYIDKCPIFEKNNEDFQKYYNSSFPLDHFPLEKATEMSFNVVLKKEPYFFRYSESLDLSGDRPFLMLDFDGFAERIPSKDYLSITDSLHNIIIDEYYKVIREPIIDYMRKEKDPNNGA